MKMTEHDSEWEGHDDCDQKGCAGQLELFESLLQQEAGVVADEPAGVDECVQVRRVGECHASPFVAHGAKARRSATSKTSQVSASATARAPAE